MTRRKKRRNLGPRRKRMRRPARLEAGLQWKTEYDGKNLVRGYVRWFGVDLLCAVFELRMLGVEVDAAYEQQLRRTIMARAAARATWRTEKLAAKTRPVEIEWPADWPIEWTPTDEDENVISIGANPYY